MDEENKRNEIINLLYNTTNKTNANTILMLIDELCKEHYNNGRICESNFESSRKNFIGGF